MSDHEYTPGRKAVRGDVEGRACIICGNLSDECDAPILQGDGVTDDTGAIQAAVDATLPSYETVSGSPVSAPPPIKPRKPRRKRGA